MIRPVMLGRHAAKTRACSLAAAHSQALLIIGFLSLVVGHLQFKAACRADLTLPSAARWHVVKADWLDLLPDSAGAVQEASGRHMPHL